MKTVNRNERGQNCSKIYIVLKSSVSFAALRDPTEGTCIDYSLICWHSRAGRSAFLKQQVQPSRSPAQAHGDLIMIHTHKQAALVSVFGLPGL